MGKWEHLGDDIEAWICFSAAWRWQRHRCWDRGRPQAARPGPQGSPGSGTATRQAQPGGVSSAATDPASWMTQNNLQSTPFSQITLYGCMISGISRSVSIAGSVVGSGPISQAQSLSIYDQVVNGGVRSTSTSARHYSGMGHPASGWYCAAQFKGAF